MNIKIDNKRRIIVMYMLMNAFNEYTLLELYRSSLNREEKSDYSARELFSNIFNLPLPETPSKDELTDKCIKHSENFEIYLKALETVGVDRKLSTSFTKALENEPKFSYLKSRHLVYAEALSYYSMYVHNGNKDQLTKGIRNLQSLDFPFTPLNLKFMIKQLLTCEYFYYNIWGKQLLRNKEFMFDDEDFIFGNQ